jgi:FkbM family methyltransferase
MNVFIDCGTNLFQGLTSFHQRLHFDRNWKIYCFEANPETFAAASKKIPQWLRPLDLQFRNEAVSIRAGTTTVNCASNDDSCMQYYDGVYWKNFLRRAFGKARRVLGVSPHTNQGSNILATPPANVDGHVFRYRKHEVPTMRLSDLVLQVAREQQPATIVVKLDIEGAEFEVLPDLFASQAAARISELYVEFHERFFVGQETRYAELRRTLVEKAGHYKSLKLHEWH